MLADTALEVFKPAIDDSSNNDVDGEGVAAEQRALARLELVADDARDFAAHAKAPNTLKAYGTVTPPAPKRPWWRFWS